MTAPMARAWTRNSATFSHASTLLSMMMTLIITVIRSVIIRVSSRCVLMEAGPDEGAPPGLGVERSLVLTARTGGDAEAEQSRSSGGVLGPTTSFEALLSCQTSPW